MNNDFDIISSKSEKGFTLIELVIVSVLLSLLGSLLYSTINGIIQAKNIVEAEIEATSKAQFIIEKIGRELSSVIPSTLNLDDPDNPDAQISLNNVSFLGQKDRLSFNSAVGGQIVNGQNNNYGTVQISYYLEPESREFSNKKTFQLIREEIPSNITDKKTVEMRRTSVAIINSVEKIKFRFYSLETWEDSWENPNIPEAVEVLFLIKDIKGNTKAYKTAYALRRS